jgi:hypothetical protein
MKYVLLAAGAAVALTSAPASAAVIIYTSAGPVQPAENVLFQTENQTGTTVQGVTNQTNTMVTFTSMTDTLLTTGSQGQARLEATDGSLDQVMFSLTNPQLTFTEAEFNLFNAFPNTTQVTISLSSGLTQTFDLSPNGQNFFGVRATDGDFLTSISFDTNGSGVSDMRQVRIGGISGSQMGAVPEPGTWAMMLLGFGAIGFALRRRKSAEGTRRLRVAYS